jgi:hypothetical protein
MRLERYLLGWSLVSGGGADVPGLSLNGISMFVRGDLVVRGLVDAFM